MKLTWQELEWMVAEKLEPKPDLKDPWRLDGLSALGFWQLHSQAGILPVQFHTDEAASARLLDAMPEPQERKFFRISITLDKAPCWRVWPDWNNSGYFYNDPDRKSARLLAAKAFLKIEGDVE